MYLIYTGSKDTYITNKIIDGAFSASDANVGQAGTIDMFKLYDETPLNGLTGSSEISRGLIKFDFSPLRALTASAIDINDSSFRVKMKLHNLLGGTAVPTNFTLVAAPLSMSFREGFGRDVSAFSDLDTANFYTASVSSGTPNTWFLSGANKGGLLNSNNIDYIVSGTIDGTLQSLVAEQTFVKGTEDMFVDITTIVSATLAGKIPDHGFRLSFTGSEENDNKSRFVKRFASLQSSNALKKPSIHIIYDDSQIDATKDFVFDISGSLYLNNFVRGSRSNFVSGAAATAITGDSCMLLRLEKGDFSKTYTAHQISRGTDSTAIGGLYSSSFAVSLSDQTVINSENEKILNFVNASGSITFDAIWCSNDETVGFHTGSLEVGRSNSSDYNSTPANLIVKAVTLPPRMQHDEILKIQFFVTNRNAQQKVYKVPYRLPSEILQNAYYRIRDLDTDQIIVPFETDYNGTKLSSDAEGIYFTLRTEILPRGRSYVIDLLIKDFGQEQIFLGVGQGFRVE
tara:strand:+ start:1625 stop:3163 length:1539 start_codon:yes stop_codon:yes gene_type:complete